MNTILRDWHPKEFVKAEAKLKADYGKTWEEMFPIDEYYQVMHLKMFPAGIVHAENIGGEINKLNNKRTWVGLFPWRAIELESCICRIVGFEFE
jgi:kynurenine formamidase